MFDIAPTELMLVALVALVVIGPKDLPRLMRTVGQWVAKARGMARHFRTGMDEMIRQSEIEEMERKWAEENARIMREHPMLRDEGSPQMTPLPASEVETPETPSEPPPPEAPKPSPTSVQPELPLSDHSPAADKPA
ncbi:MAG: Sec-independent protein translocase protein TatB [Sphingomonadaceae bacterium]